MHRLAQVFFAALPFATVACTDPFCSSTDPDVDYHRVTLEPTKTQSLFADVEGVWEATTTDGKLVQLSLCRSTVKYLQTDDIDLASTLTTSREVVLNETTGGSMDGCGEKLVPSVTAVASWKGSWAIAGTGKDVTVSFVTPKDPYPAIISLSADLAPLPNIGLDPKSLTVDRMAKTLEATTYSVDPSKPSGSTQTTQPSLTFSKVGIGECASADPGEAAAEDAGQGG